MKKIFNTIHGMIYHAFLDLQYQLFYKTYCSGCGEQLHKLGAINDTEVKEKALEFVMWLFERFNKESKSYTINGFYDLGGYIRITGFQLQEKLISLGLVEIESDNEGDEWYYPIKPLRELMDKIRKEGEK